MYVALVYDFNHVISKSEAFASMKNFKATGKKRCVSIKHIPVLSLKIYTFVLYNDVICTLSLNILIYVPVLNNIYSKACI